MKEFKEISKDQVINELKENRDVRAVILTSNSHIVKGGEFIKEGVYQLNCRMAIADIARYEKEDNVVFFTMKNDEE